MALRLKARQQAGGVQVPYDWEPRSYQWPAWQAFEDGCRFFNMVWHRRAGKDDLWLNRIAVELLEEPATYWYFFPEKEHIRKALWLSVDAHTKMRRLEHIFPRELFPKWNETDMSIESVAGGRVQFLGSDSYDTAVGAGPKGVVFSEWSLARAEAWAFVQPMIEETGGWAAFIYTPRGMNHGWRWHEAAVNDNEWFSELLTVQDTSVFTAAQLARIRNSLIAQFGEDDGEMYFQQEYMCAFNSNAAGAFYGAVVRRAEQQGRIGLFPWSPTKRVATSWDIGRSDATAIWFWQMQDGMRTAIDYYEKREEDLTHYVRWLTTRPYNYYQNIWPHDADRKTWNPQTYIEIASGLGLQNIEIQERTSVMERVNAVRANFPSVRINVQPWSGGDESPEMAAARMQRGIDALRGYQKVYDTGTREFLDRPKYTWHRDGADAFGYGIQRLRPDLGHNLQGDAISYTGQEMGQRYDPFRFAGV